MHHLLLAYRQTTSKQAPITTSQPLEHVNENSQESEFHHSVAFGLCDPRGEMLAGAAAAHAFVQFLMTDHLCKSLNLANEM